MTRIAMKPTLQPELFVYSFPVRVYFENTDAGGVVYHGEYLMPARFDDALQVSVELIKVGAGLIEVFQRVLRAEELVARATVKVACVGLRTMRPVRIPQPLATRIKVRTSE